jgi:hypothetical protein
LPPGAFQDKTGNVQADRAGCEHPIHLALVDSGKHGLRLSLSLHRQLHQRNPEATGSVAVDPCLRDGVGIVRMVWEEDTLGSWDDFPEDFRVLRP